MIRIQQSRFLKLESHFWSAKILFFGNFSVGKNMKKLDIDFAEYQNFNFLH